MATLLRRLPVLLPQLIPPLDGSRADLLLSLYIGIAVLLVRLIAERTVLPAFKRALKPYAAPDQLDRTAFRVFDNTFTATFCSILTLWAWYVTLFDNGGCTPFSTKACLGTWPNAPLTRQFQLVWLSIGGYYTYEMIGTVLQTGCILKAEMIAHHVITMTLMLYGYFYSINRHCLMATALLDTSNALLHATKALNYAAIPQLEHVKDVVSVGFVVTFFCCRVVLPPFTLIKPALTDGSRMPQASHYLLTGMLLFIYSLQLFWWYKIVQIALGRESQDEEDSCSSSDDGELITAEVTVIVTATRPQAAGSKKLA